MESPSPDAQDNQSLATQRTPRRFGSYVLLSRLARGGMGEVWLAKQRGIADIERLCVVKMIRSIYTEDREYVARFIDEARTVVLLTHPNVCQVFDVGAIDGVYYLAMEVVFGRDLRTVEDRAHEQGVQLSLPIVVHVMSEMLDALDYAHKLKHPARKTELGIVHRDVSPQNTIVGFDGNVKLIDFGLATSTLKAEQTEPGVVLGKLQYMAPEHARGSTVDRRADIFPAGVMLYELLAGERYYNGLSLDGVWNIAGKGGHRPAKLATLPPPVQRIIERATAPLLVERYQTCGEFLRDLREVADAAPARDVSALMARLFPGEEQKDRKERARLMALPMPDEERPNTSVRFAASVDSTTDREAIASTSSMEPEPFVDDSPTAPAREPAQLDELPPTIPTGRPAFRLSDLPAEPPEQTEAVVRSAPKKSWTVVVVVGVIGFLAVLIALLLR